MKCEELLAANGVDYAEAMERFGGNKELYKKIAVKFIDDPHYAGLREALDRNDAEEAYLHAHTLKGVAGNLSFGNLYRAGMPRHRCAALRRHDRGSRAHDGAERSARLRHRRPHAAEAGLTEKPPAIRRRLQALECAAGIAGSPYSPAPSSPPESSLPSGPFFLLPLRGL